MAFRCGDRGLVALRSAFSFIFQSRPAALAATRCRSFSAPAASLLAHTVDRYGAVHVDAGMLPNVASLAPATGRDGSAASIEFASQLDASLLAWEAAGRKAAWIQIPAARSALVPAAIARGFSFHHADPQAQTLVLTKWLAVNDKNMLPPYAHTTLGVGAFVVNEKEEALVILEKFSHAPDFWKLPGGAVDVDEELTVAAEREVKEETGVTATFESLVAFRHLHAFRFGRGDIYNVCVLRAAPGAAALPLRPQAEEIAQVRWAPLREVFAYPHLRAWMPLVQPAVEHEVRRMLHDPSLPPAGARPVRIPRVVGARWPGETSAMYVVGPTNKA